jgi:hypothetical protein
MEGQSKKQTTQTHSALACGKLAEPNAGAGGEGVGEREACGGRRTSYARVNMAMTYGQFTKVIQIVCESHPEHATRAFGELLEAFGTLLMKQVESSPEIRSKLQAIVDTALAERDRSVALQAVMTSMSKPRGEG